jgi:hypothetical protein
MATPLYLLTPSFFALVINGILLFILSFIVIFNFRSFIKTDYIKLLPIIAIISIAFGIHGSLHLGLEQAYNFNPLYMFFS